MNADGSVTVSVYPASSRARLPAAKQKSYPRPPERAPRLEQAGGKRAANARTRRSAARAAKRAERREQAEARLQQLASLGLTSGRTDKNLCRCFGAPACRVSPDHLIT